MGRRNDADLPKVLLPPKSSAAHPYSWIGRGLSLPSLKDWIPPMRNLRVLLVSLVVALALPACRRHGSSPSKGPNPMAGNPVVTPASHPSTSVTTTFVRCPEAEAETVLVAELTISGLFGSRPYVLPVRRESLCDGDGRLRLISDDQEMEFGDGKANGHGLGYGGEINVVAEPNNDIVLDVFVYWTSAYGVVGQLHQEVHAPPGQKTEYRLSNAAFLKVHFRDATRR